MKLSVFEMSHQEQIRATLKLKEHKVHSATGKGCGKMDGLKNTITPSFEVFFFIKIGNKIDLSADWQ